MQDLQSQADPADPADHSRPSDREDREFLVFHLFLAHPAAEKCHDVIIIPYFTEISSIFLRSCCRESDVVSGVEGAERR